MKNTVLSCFIFFISVSLAFARDRQQYCMPGAFLSDKPSGEDILKFKHAFGKKPSLIMVYLDWGSYLDKEVVAQVYGQGCLLIVTWEPWSALTKGEIDFSALADGRFDSYIKEFAKQIKDIKETVFLRFAHEPNGNWYPWSGEKIGRHTYLAAYRHVHNVFKRLKVANTRWVFTINWEDVPKKNKSFLNFYPGDNYVDYIGIDGYNWGKTQSWSDWQSFKVLFRDQVRLARRKWPTKPIMIAEFASAEKGGDKAAWIKELPDYFRTSIRDVDAIVWFDHKKETDWRINSSDKSLAAYKAIMKDPIFSSAGAIMLAAYTEKPDKGGRNLAGAPKAPGTVTIDGNLNDWDKTYPITMKDISFFKEGLNWQGPLDLSGNLYLMWDAANLYLAAEVTDKIPMVNKKEKQDIWNGDAIELVFTTNTGADPNRDSFGRGDYQVGFGTGDGLANTPTIWSWQRHRSPAGSEIFVKKIAQPQGYVLEAKIPWTFFGSGFIPSAGIKVGFDIALDDADTTGEREKQFIWNGDFGFYRDPSVWGVLEFK